MRSGSRGRLEDRDVGVAVKGLLIRSRRVLLKVFVFFLEKFDQFVH